MYVLTAEGLVLSGFVVSESKDKVRLIMSESEEESWYDKSRCAFSVGDLIRQAVDNDFSWSFEENQFDRKNSNALYNRLRDKKDGLDDIPVAIPEDFDYSTIFAHKSNLDVQMNIEEWIEYTVTDESEERTGHYGLPPKVGKEEQSWNEEYVRLDIYTIKEYPHTISGLHGKLCKYACIEGKVPSAETLMPWDEMGWSPWSYSVKTHTTKNRHGITSGFRGIIYRNGVVWDECFMNSESSSLLWCQHNISQYTHHFYGTDLRMKDWHEELKGYKFTWKGLPLTIDYIVIGQAAIITNEEVDSDGDIDTLKLSMLGDNLDWFPEFNTEDVEPKLVIENDSGSKEEEHD